MLLYKAESGQDARSWTNKPMWHKKFQKGGALHRLPASRERLIIKGKSSTKLVHSKIS